MEVNYLKIIQCDFKRITASKLTCLLDPVPTKLLKELLPVAEEPLSQIDPCELANYRPISNLPFMSNILENVVSAQLCSFLQKSYIYEDFQSGFSPPP